MVKHIDIFISSTSRDLQAYRARVTQAVLHLGLHPIIMEAFNPTDRNALQLCYDKIQNAEIFIGIYAHRYGYVPGKSVTYTTVDGETCSCDGQTGITEMEYQWAIERDIPVLLFVVDENLSWSPDDIGGFCILRRKTP